MLAKMQKPPDIFEAGAKCHVRLGHPRPHPLHQPGVPDDLRPSAHRPFLTSSSTGGKQMRAHEHQQVFVGHRFASLRTEKSW